MGFQFCHFTIKFSCPGWFCSTAEEPRCSVGLRQNSCCRCWGATKDCSLQQVILTDFILSTNQNLDFTTSLLSFTTLFSPLGLSPRAVSTSFGCRQNIAICLQGASSPDPTTVYVDLRALRYIYLRFCTLVQNLNIKFQARPSHFGWAR